jgi:transcriptional regulator with XRE-family HTH domain
MLTRIREVRKAKGLTLLDVAERCAPPTTAQTIGRLETGTRTVSVGWLNRIAAALGVESSELVTLTGRPDIAVAAILAADGAQAPRKPLTIVPPAPTAAMIGILVEAAQGEYRAGDMLWAETLAAGDYGRAINRDVLVPRPVGRFVFGRLVGIDGHRIQIQPLAPGARQQVIADAPWLAVVKVLIRNI